MIKSHTIFVRSVSIRNLRTNNLLPPRGHMSEQGPNPQLCRRKLKQLAIKAILLSYPKNSEVYAWASSTAPWDTIYQGMRPIIIPLSICNERFHGSTTEPKIIAGHLAYHAVTASEMPYVKTMISLYGCSIGLQLEQVKLSSVNPIITFVLGLRSRSPSTKEVV